MSSIIWYLLVAFISIGFSIYIIYAERKIYKISSLVVFYIFVAGAAWIGEFTVLGLFNSYAYRTGVFTDVWAQNLFGHLILNTSLYPTAAIVIIAYSLRYRWIALFTVLFVFLEYLFIKLGIYEQHWWKYYMTAIIVVTYLSFCKYWFPRILQKPDKAARAFTFYFVAMVIVHIPAPVLLLLNKQNYQLNFVKKLVGNYYLSSTLVSFIHHLLMSFVLVLFTCIPEKWYWKAVPFIVTLIVPSTYYKTGIIMIHDGWNIIYYMVIQQICVLAFVLLEKFTLKYDSVRS